MSRVGKMLGLAGGAVVFALAAGGGLLVHMNVPAVRRAITARVNSLLASALPGHVVITRLGGLGWGGIDDADVTVDDPRGSYVMRVQGLGARIATMDLLRSLVSGQDLQVDIEDVSIASADLSLDLDPSGMLRLVRAFVRDQPPSPATPARGVQLRLGHVALGHVIVHGQPAAGIAVDADVDHVLAALQAAPGTLVIHLREADVKVRGLPGGGEARGMLRETHLEQPSRRGGDRGAHFTWNGTVSGIPTTAEATYEGGALDVVLDVPSARPDQIRALWPACPFGATASAHVEVAGAIPALYLDVHASLGPGAVDMRGPLWIADRKVADLRVTATSVDAHAVAPSAPATQLDATGDVLLTAAASGAMGGLATLDVSGTVEGNRVPAATVEASLERAGSPGAAASGQARVVVHEPGATASVDATLAPKGDSYVLGFDARAVVPRLDRVAQLPPVARGQVQASALGTLDLRTMRVDAQVRASAAQLAAGPVRLGVATVSGRASGPVAAPALDVDLHGDDLEVPGLLFSSVRAIVHGSATTAEVSLSMRGHGADVRAKATVGAEPGGVAVRDLHVLAERGNETARVRAALVSLTGHEQRVDDAELLGFGEALAASVRASPGSLVLSAHSRGLDLARLGRFLGVAAISAGRVVVDADATIRSSRADGHIVLDVARATAGPLHDAGAHVDVTLEGRRASGTVSAHVADIGSLEVRSSSVEVAGSEPLSLSSWRRAWGAADVEGHVDLAKLVAMVPAAALPVQGLAGTLDVQGHLARDSASDVSPDVDVTAKTTGLVASGPPGAPWTLKGVDGELRLRVDGQTAQTSLDARATDSTGVLVALAASSHDVPYARLFSSDAPLLEVARTMPSEGSITIPARDLAGFPAFFGTRGVHGQLSASVTWSGTPEHPTIDAHAALGHAQADVTVLSLPLDLDLTAHYDGAHADATLVASGRGAQMLSASTGVDILATDLLAAPGGAAPPWKASARAKLTRFPLQTLAVLDDRQVRGHASGEVSVDGLHDDARASLDLTADDLTVGEIACKGAGVELTFDGHVLGGATHVEEEDGSIQASAHIGARWGAAMTPTLDSTQPADVSMTAKNFRAGVLQPLLSSVFAELDGRVDADVQVHADRATRTLAPLGTIKLSGGVIELASVGGEFHDASAVISLTPDGVVKLQSASAKGLSGKIEAAATARFSGARFVGARGIVQVPHQEPLPLVLDGVQVGMFDGQIGLDVDPAASGPGLDVKVAVDKALLQLPEGNTRTVQSLGALQGVRVGFQRPGHDFVVQPLDGPVAAVSSAGRAQSPLKVTVALGSDVEVRRGSTLDVRLTGSPTLTVTDAVTAAGQVRLVRGTIQVQGKTFTLENGTITFVDDPTNPQVVLTASWAAPAGTTVYADFVGPLKTGKVTLRADPARPQNEILALILFGTTDQQATASAGGPSGQQSNAAVGAAGGAATAPINQALGGVNQALDNFGFAGGITTKVDTSQTTPRPEVELQIAKDISIQVAWVLGVPPPGSNPDTTLFTLDWRFLKSWSLETTVGDAGTSILDLVWQHRY